MYAPLLIALELAARPGLDVRFSSTTRSPVLAVDEPGYPIRTALRFDAADGERTRTTSHAGSTTSSSSLDTDDAAVWSRHCVRVTDARARRPAAELPPVAAAARCAARRSAATRPTRSAWLLTDLSDVELEAPTEEREEAVQSGGAHYAESLPIEYQPTPEYQALFAAALDESAQRLAHAVGVVTELVLDVRGPDAVLASLARAGTPIGILMRRWAQRRARARPAALRRVDRARPRHRPVRAAVPGRAPRSGAGDVRRRVDGQGRDRARAAPRRVEGTPFSPSSRCSPTPVRA